MNNNFYEIAKKAKTDKVGHHGYHFFYPTFISDFKNEKFKMLEIGYLEGCSANLWENYFPHAEIFFLDIQREVATERHRVFKGDQSNLNDLNRICDQIKSAKLIIDDGSHNPSHQFSTFSFLFRNLLEPGGVYIIEDIECSYWKSDISLYGYTVGSFNMVNKTVEFIDQINAEFSKTQNDLQISMISYGQNCIIIKKQTEEESEYFKRQYRWYHNLK